MLRISEQNTATTIRRYYATGRYFEQGLGIVGVWGGLGARRLGLRGTVTRAALERLCDNIHPVTGQQLTARMRGFRMVAYTFRFSLSKSVSLLYGMYQDKAILETFRTAVSGTMREMETELKTRVRKAGQQGERVTGNMVWAEFIHTAASPVRGLCDPQLHAYVCVFNATWDEEEECWKAGWFQDLKRDAPYFELVFRVRCAYLLRSLGYSIERDGRDFEIAGVPANVLKEFSRRKEVVEQQALALGVIDPKVKGKLGPKTREGNVAAFWTQESLRKEWAGRLLQGESEALADVYQRRRPPSKNSRRLTEILDEALHRFARRGAVSERRLLMHMLTSGMGEVTVAAIRQELVNRPAIRVGDGREKE